jgi:hypothetical protein
MEIRRWKYFREPFTPLHQHDGVLVDDLLQSEGREIIGVFDPIEVHVINLESIAIFVDQRECRAGHRFFPGSAQTGDDAFRQSRLAAPQFPFQYHQARGMELACQLPARGQGLLRGMSHRFRHHSICRGIQTEIPRRPGASQAREQSQLLRTGAPRSRIAGARQQAMSVLRRVSGESCECLVNHLQQVAGNHGVLPLLARGQIAREPVQVNGPGDYLRDRMRLKGSQQARG